MVLYKLEQLLEALISDKDEYCDLLYAQITKYRENLSYFLKIGVEKAASLLEQMNQRLKKTTSHNRGGKFIDTQQGFGETFQFFWNATPIKFKDESEQDKKSPFQRITNTSAKDSPFDFSQPWWKWLQPLDYHRYRKHVKEIKNIHINEYKNIQIYKSSEEVKSEKDPAIKAKKRWMNSKTLKIVAEHIHSISDSYTKEEKFETIINSLLPHEKYLFSYIQSFPSGILRSLLYRRQKYAKSTFSGILYSLEKKGLIQCIIVQPGPSCKRGEHIFPTILQMDG